MQKYCLVMVLCLGLLTFTANASTVTFSGYFNDSASTALVGSDLGGALFGDDDEIANNVALYSLIVPVGGTVTFDSKGYAAGGADPYFTLFTGSGGTATFLGSNYTQAFSTGGDFSLSFALAAGDYTFAMAVFANMSFNENYGYGSLGDEFIGLGVSYCLGNYYYKLDVSMPDTQSIPEPCAFFLVAFGLAGLIGIKKRFASRRL